MQQYSELFRKYYLEYIQKSNNYFKRHCIRNGSAIHIVNHPEYFEIQKEWEHRRKELDDPILIKAKYKIGQKVIFKNSNGINPTGCMYTGVINHITTCDGGSGAICYHFDRTTPSSPVSNPTCWEDDIIDAR